MPVQVEEYYSTYYTGIPGSKSCIFCTFVVALALILPLFLAFSTRDFIISVETASLAATVEYSLAYAQILTDDQGSSHFYSNIPKFQSLNSLNYAYSYGSNSKTNEKNLTIYLETSLPDTSRRVVSGSFMPVLRFNVTDYINWYTQDFITLDFGKSGGVDSVNFQGNLQLSFYAPIDYYTVLNNRYDYSVLQTTSVTTAGSFPKADILQAKYLRNQTLYSTYNFSPNYSNTNNLVLNLTLSQPDKYELLVRPGLFHSVKIAWTNYIFIFIPIWFLQSYILIFSYKNSVFATTKFTDQPDKYRMALRKFGW